MKNSTVQVLSFISGLTLAPVVIGVTISKSPGLKNEIESQLNTILKTTRALVDAYKSVASKSKTAVSLIKNDAGDMTPEQQSAAEEQKKHIDSQWDVAEAEIAQ